MDNDVFNSLEDLDNKLDEEFGVVANTSEENSETIDENVDTETSEELEENTDNSDENGEESTDKNEELSASPNIDTQNDKADSKKEHAFADLRAQNSALRREKDSLKANSDFLKDLAASYGYTDLDEFQKAYKNARMQQEAEKKGYDPELYRKTIEQQERIEALEKQREQDLLNRKIERLRGALEVAAKDYSVDEREIFDRFSKSGLTADDIISIPNPRLLIDGLMVDKIKENAKQSQINDIKNMKNLAEDDNEGNSTPTAITIDSLLKEDLAKYKADNFYE